MMKVVLFLQPSEGWGGDTDILHLCHKNILIQWGKVCVLVKVCVLPGIFQSKRVEMGWENVVTRIKKRLWAF